MILCGQKTEAHLIDMENIEDSVEAKYTQYRLKV